MFALKKKISKIMVFIPLFIPIILLLAPYQVYCSTIELMFKEKAVIEGERILLGDVAEITTDNSEDQLLKQEPIAISPQPGKSKKINTEEVVSRLQQTTTADILNWHGPPIIEVMREGTGVDKELYSKIINEYIRKNSDNLPTSDIDISLIHTPPPFTLPKTGIEWEVIPSGPKIITSSSFSILFKQNGKLLRKIQVKVRIKAFADVAAASTTLYRGTIINSDQLTMTHRNLALIGNPFLKPQVLIGSKVKKTIPSGQIIGRDDIELESMVSKGEQVKIFAIKSPMSVSALGIALSDGIPGEIIKVKNSNSKITVTGRVLGRGKVIVEKW